MVFSRASDYSDIQRFAYRYVRPSLALGASKSMRTLQGWACQIWLEQRSVHTHQLAHLRDLLCRAPLVPKQV